MYHEFHFRFYNVILYHIFIIFRHKNITTLSIIFYKLMFKAYNYASNHVEDKSYSKWYNFAEDHSKPVYESKSPNILLTNLSRKSNISSIITEIVSSIFFSSNSIVCSLNKTDHYIQSIYIRIHVANSVWMSQSHRIKMYFYKEKDTYIYSLFLGDIRPTCSSNPRPPI